MSINKLKGKWHLMRHDHASVWQIRPPVTNFVEFNCLPDVLVWCQVKEKQLKHCVFRCRRGDYQAIIHFWYTYTHICIIKRLVAIWSLISYSVSKLFLPKDRSSPFLVSLGSDVCEFCNESFTPREQ